jgi:hypothetical protein
MINVRARIKLIEELLSQDTVQAATYAALECRSTIEALCYERFAISNSHLSTADLKKWQPRDVIRQVLEEANASAAAPLVLMVARPEEAHRVGKVDPADLEYVEVGRQVELRYNALARLHNALSGVALHIKIPDAGEAVEIYGDKGAIERKVEETLQELEAASAGTLLMGSMQSDISFECFCGSTIKRKAAMLQEGQVVCCNRPECKESYTVSLEGPDVYFTRRSHSLDCICKEPIDIPERMVRELKLGDHLVAECGSCKGETVFKWSLLAAQRAPVAAPPAAADHT